MKEPNDRLSRPALPHEGPPSEARRPAESTAEALNELDAGGGERFASVDDLMKDLEG